MNEWSSNILIGCLMYIMPGTRSNLSYHVNYLRQFQNCHNVVHWNYLKLNLKQSDNYALKFIKSETLITSLHLMRSLMNYLTDIRELFYQMNHWIFFLNISVHHIRCTRQTNYYFGNKFTLLHFLMYLMEIFLLTAKIAFNNLFCYNQFKPDRHCLNLKWKICNNFPLF